MMDDFLIGGHSSSTVAPIGPSGPYQDNVVEAYASDDDVEIAADGEGQVGEQFEGMVFRVIDDRLFVVHPGPPPEAPSA